MKKNFKYALLGAIVLTGAVGFSACQSSDEVVENPNYNPEDKTVKTEFVINVTQPNERTRQTSTVVGNSDFQGLNDMYLLSFTGVPATSTAIAATQVHSLNSFTTGPALSGDNTTNSSKWYTLYIPGGTSNFLFYAKTTNGDPANHATDGKLNYYVTKDASNNTIASVGNINFSLASIASSSSSEITTAETTLSDYLNTIAHTNDWAGSVNLRDNGSTQTEKDNYKALADAYQQFTSYNTEGFRQGSATAILATVGALHGVMEGIRNNSGNPEAVRTIATAVQNNIATNFTISGDAAPYTATFKNISDASITDFPIAQGLPAGSAILKFTSSADNPFSYTNDGTSGAATIATPLAKFTYPSELAYYCNSALRATTSDVTTSTLPNNSGDWIDDSKWPSGWTQTAVDGSTRAVAMKENVTFGVAQLHSTISLSGVTDKKFTDNAASVTASDGISGNDLANQEIDLSNDGDYLKVTGIIIGGQPESAGYDYLPNSTNFGYAIYDKIESGNVSEKDVLTGDAEFFTLVLDNYSSTSQDAVNVAIELVASKDFYGKDGLIKAGQPFYLIGALNSSNKGAESTIDWTKQVSFESGDNGYNTERVFIRDAVTTANFTLTATSLQKAYSTIPDLRSTQMVFGLSVDLKWKAGLTYNISF